MRSCVILLVERARALVLARSASLRVSPVPGFCSGRPPPGAGLLLRERICTAGTDLYSGNDRADVGAGPRTSARGQVFGRMSVYGTEVGEGRMDRSRVVAVPSRPASGDRARPGAPRNDSVHTNTPPPSRKPASARTPARARTSVDPPRRPPGREIRIRARLQSSVDPPMHPPDREPFTIASP